MSSVTSCPVNIPWDFTLPITIGSHMLLAPPAVPAPAPTAAVEMIATIAWTAGFVLGKNKFTTTVSHKSGFIMQEGHDIGPLIPDVTIPPTNVWYAKMWPLSKREVKFSSSTVKMNGKAVGCTTIIPPFVMICCGEPISIPFGYSVICPLNTVRVGMTLGDIFAGALSIVVSVGLDIIFNKIGGKLGDRFGARLYLNSLFSRLANQSLIALGRNLTSSFFRNQALNLIKNTLSGLAGAGITALTGTGNPQIKIGIGNSWVGGEAVIDVSGQDEHGAEGHAFGFQPAAGSSDSQTPWSNF